GSCRIFTGARRRWRNTFTLVRTPVPNQVYVLCISSDLTDIAFLQQTIKSNVEQLNGLLNNIDDAVFALDNDWTISSANPSGQQLAVRMAQSADPVGCSFWEAFPIAQGEPTAMVIHRAMESKTVERCEYFCAVRQMWLSIKLFPRVDGLSVLARDITQLKKMQQLAAEEHVYLQVAHDVAGFGDWSFDYNQGEMQFSPSAIAMLELDNCPLSELKQRLLAKLDSRDRMALVQAIINCTEVAPRIDLVVRMSSQNSTEKRVRWSGRLLTDESGNAARLLGAVQLVSVPAVVGIIERAREMTSGIPN
ncbi:MAG TPA: PAS domain-containing protein, partial [Spongiibacteraceae bacterium]|nr:PAS domain-containing protein [Spongiibacteraceae bacterium]